MTIGGRHRCGERARPRVSDAARRRPRRVDEVVALDLRSPAAVPAGVEVRAVDLVTADLERFLEGADAVIHLASVFGPAIDGPEIEAAVDVAMARGCSTPPATVGLGGGPRLVGDRLRRLGQQPGAAHRGRAAAPAPDLAYAVPAGRDRAPWRRLGGGPPAATVGLLRPAPVVDDGRAGWLARALDAGRRCVPTADDPPAQYLHLDDLAAAVVIAWSAAPRRAGQRGPRRLAHRHASVAALDPCPALRLPEPARPEVASWRWRLRLAPTPPGILPYVRHPWVVANDRLRGGGLGADVQQRGGLRHGPRGRTDRAALARAPPGAGARRRGGVRSSPPASRGARRHPSGAAGPSRRCGAPVGGQPLGLVPSVTDSVVGLGVAQDDGSDLLARVEVREGDDEVGGRAGRAAVDADHDVAEWPGALAAAGLPSTTLVRRAPPATPSRVVSGPVRSTASIPSQACGSASELAQVVGDVGDHVGGDHAAPAVVRVAGEADAHEPAVGVDDATAERGRGAPHGRARACRRARQRSSAPRRRPC